MGTRTLHAAMSGQGQKTGQRDEAHRHGNGQCVAENLVSGVNRLAVPESHAHPIPCHLFSMGRYFGKLLNLFKTQSLILCSP